MDKEHEILFKARDLFLTYGLRSITMDDLAHELGISKKTLYQHFKDKADIIRKMAFMEINRLESIMYEFMKNYSNTIDRMIMINQHVIDMTRKTPPAVKFDLGKYYPEIQEETKKLMEKKMFDAVKENHRKGQEEGLIREDLNLDFIAALQVCRSNYVKGILDMTEDLTHEEIINQIFDYHIRAIATPKGLEYYLKNNKKSE